MSTDYLTPVLTGRTLLRANPVSKLFAAVVITLALMASIDWVSAAVALTCELALMPLLGISVIGLARRIWPLLVAALIGAYGTALLAEKTGGVLLDVGPFLFTEGSVAAGIAVGLRGLPLALPGIFILLTTDPTDLADALAQKLRLPSRFVLGALASLRLVGLLVEQWDSLGLARHARGVGSDGSALARTRNLLGQSFGLIVQAIRRATRLATAMEARGFGAGTRTWARESTYSLLDAGIAVVGLLVAVGAVTAAVLAGTWNFILG
ncbi:energy-coupling factor transporter transmembrane protein EcfT [Arthrobacter agilis]|uniref:energy-coupling factor transporter transmembrane component T family protein n=1 Tax=Arthrobacter agilis TaxID=37921 RepID=UPI000B34F595|nr:energy-coupling factor transporter transmembrane component T [Arthrobacter agilis]OUM43104.1 cobalt transporter [Arthrobacter agilis]PPB46048.1 energy-coupling factor transporter transmembrane protein EcfT [Arthrobacter agilis]TPV25590.1 energy-coupling factor transporter transmembrane protein EcfT [Arthrobacter agilis]VDR33358.1 Putative HMP/thiamine permease protein YkoC [Arthrobacter agilis]